MGFYDIHDFIVAVEGPADKIFSKEYSHFKVHVTPRKIDLFVKIYEGNEDLPTRPAGSLKGMRIPFADDENTLWYEKGTALEVLLSYCEALMWWPNKVILHTGGVAKNGNALIFTGSGNVGKTSIVLNLLKEGYEYLSDDWIVIGEGKAYPLPKLVHIFDYNLKNKEIARSVLGLKRFFYKPFFELIEAGRKYSPHRYVRYALEFLKPTFCVDLQKINPNAKVASPAFISKIFYLERQDVKDIHVTDDIGADDLARRMAYVNLYEWDFFFREYYKYVSHYGITSKKIENKFNHDFSLMQGTFENAKRYRVTIPIKLDLTSVKLDSKFGLN